MLKCEFCGGKLHEDEQYILINDKPFCEECVSQMSVTELCEEADIKSAKELAYELNLEWHTVPSLLDYSSDEAYAMIVDELFERRDERCAI